MHAISSGKRVARRCMLPDPEAASPPIQPKFTAIWRKLAAISNFSKILLLFRYFWSFSMDLQLEEMPNFSLN
jgi:hypothetical protein